jgi:hypothetical protein
MTEGTGKREEMKRETERERNEGRGLRFLKDERKLLRDYLKI